MDFLRNFLRNNGWFLLRRPTNDFWENERTHQKTLNLVEKNLFFAFKESEYANEYLKICQKYGR